MKSNDPNFVDFGDVARERCNQQCQYASRYINQDGRWLERGYPQLGLGLRFLNLDTGSYHDILIHKDDVETFVTRYLVYTDMVRQGFHRVIAEGHVMQSAPSVILDSNGTLKIPSFESWKKVGEIAEDVDDEQS